MELILASASPRRAELLRAAGFTFRIVAADVDETVWPGEPPDPYVQRLAAEKARLVAREHPNAIVIGADTAVLIDGLILGKPASAAAAVQMLERLSGRDHEVVTGVCVMHRGRALQAVARSRVHLAALSRDEIDWYVATGEPFDKAGAYAVQGLASCFIERIEGSCTNVVGLPVSVMYRLLREIGVTMRAAGDTGAIDRGGVQGYSETE